MKPIWDVIMKLYSNGLGHMTKMIYGKNLKKNPSPELLDGFLWESRTTKVYLNEDLKIDLDLFYGKIKFGPTDFFNGRG